MLCLMKTERVVGEFERTEEQKRASNKGPGEAGSLGPSPLVLLSSRPVFLPQGLLTQEGILTCFESVRELFL